MHDEQDIRRMGGLRKYLPVTSATFIIGWLAIAGVPPFAGFWSKDEILLFAYDKSPILWAVGLVTALLTAFYMSRQVFLVFYGPERWRDVAATADGEEEAVAGAGHGDGHGGFEPHESPWPMTLPLIVLAGLAIAGGALNLPFDHSVKFLEQWLEPVVHEGERHLTVAASGKWVLAVVAIAGSLAGIASAFAVYLRHRVPAERIELDVLAHAWYYDETITKVVGGPGMAAFEATATGDRKLVDGVVNGAGRLVRGGGGYLRKVQTGYVRNYALGVAVGAFVQVGVFLTRAGG
jgi:NADH-quinone oxidoreductase subunit L